MQRIGLYIFVGAFLCGVTFVSLVSVPWSITGAVAVMGASVCGFVYRRHSNIYVAAVICVLAFAFGMARTQLAPSALPEVFTPLIDTKVQLRGVVVLMPDLRESNQRLIVKIVNGSSSTRIIAGAQLYPAVHVGDEVIVSGKITRPASFEADGGRTFAYDQFLRKDGVFAVVQPAYIAIEGESSNIYLKFLRMLEWVKDEFTRAVDTALPEPESALAVGLVAGGKQGLGKELIDAFTTAGMLQIIVLSGYNVMIVAEYILKMLSFLRKRTASIVAAVSIVCFVLAAGAGTSALRAGIMALFALYARATGKQYQVLRILSVSLFLLILWNPLLLVFDPGLQFSFLATVGLIIGSPLITERMRFITNETFCEMLSTTLAAQIGVLPFLLWQTGNLSLVAVVANLLAMPVIPAAMGLSTAAAALSIPLGYIFPVLPLIAGFPAYVLLTYVIHVATLSAHVPFANVILPAFPFWCVIVSYVFLIWLVVRLQRTAPMPAGIGAVTKPI
ncbi:MAG: Competence protein ComEC [Parcubacteria group bacterium]|nr:Competence protein ComEC [Parcubacteria group bacterium]